MLTQTTTTAFQISNVAVTFVRYNIVDTESRRQLSNTLQFLRSTTVLDTVVVDATFTIGVLLGDTTYTTTSSLYTVLTTNIQTYVQSGNYTITLHKNALSLGTTEFNTVTATAVTTSNPVVSTPSSDSSAHSSVLNTNEIIGIVIATCAGIILLLCVLLCVCGRVSASVCDSNNITITNASSTNDTNSYYNNTTYSAGSVTVVPIQHTRVPEAAVRVLHTHSQDDIPYPQCSEVYVVECNPQLAHAVV